MLGHTSTYKDFMLSIDFKITDMSGIKNAQTMRLAIGWATKEALGYTGVKLKKEMESQVAAGKGPPISPLAKLLGQPTDIPYHWKAGKMHMGRFIVYRVGTSKGMQTMTLFPGKMKAGKRSKLAKKDPWVTKAAKKMEQGGTMPLFKTRKRVKVPARPAITPAWNKMRGRLFGLFHKKFLERFAQDLARRSTKG